MAVETSSVLPDTIADALRAEVLAHDIRPGDSVTESAVALRFGASRPTARLAIDRLVADGILRREAHQAARVPRLDHDDVTDLFAARAVLESAAAAALAEAGSAPPAAVAAHRALEQNARAGAAFAADDVAFHRALVAGQPSPRLKRLHESLMGEVELCIGQVQTRHLLTADEVAAQHRAILDAITAGDAGAAAALARAHIETARDALLAAPPTD